MASSTACALVQAIFCASANQLLLTINRKAQTPTVPTASTKITRMLQGPRYPEQGSMRPEEAVGIKQELWGYLQGSDCAFLDRRIL